jgi:DNA-binding transcriptional LysR family regulator
MPPQPFRVAFVPGVTPDRWSRIWAERLPRVPLQMLPVPEDDQEPVLYDGRADMCFVRLPVDRDRLHVIPLYVEQPVVVIPKEHFAEAADEVTTGDLAGEHVLTVPPLTAKQALETVAAGTGVVVLPLSVARLHHRKDVLHRPVTDAPTTQIGLAWVRVDDDPEREELRQTFIGIVRGRRATSSRGPVAAPAPGPAAATKKGSAPRPAGRRGKAASRGRPQRRGRRP